VDRLEAMSILVAAVDAGSFSGASRRLGMPLPTVSRKVSELERHLGTRLLTRSTRKLALTDAGEAYLAACKRILEQVGEAERTAAGEYLSPRGDVMLTAPIVFGRLHLVPVVCEFLAQFREINVQLTLSDRNLHLPEDQIDVAVRIGKLADSSMVAVRVGAVKRVVCASPGFLEANGSPAKPEDLTGLPCVTFDGPMSGTAWRFDSKGSQHSVDIRPRLRVNTAESAIDAAIQGVGLTQVLSYQAAAAVAAGTLKLVLRKFESDPIPVSLVHTSQRLLPLKVRSFIEFASTRLRERSSNVDEMFRKAPPGGGR
jgi:DNA-binding transcriptional LysR family regulator